MIRRCVLPALVMGVALSAVGCAARTCMRKSAQMPVERLVQQNEPLLQQLVEQRRQAAQAQQQAGEQSSESGSLTRSVQAWEMSIRLVAQLRNLSRDSEGVRLLSQHRELVAQIVCLARAWASRSSFKVSANAAQKMLSYDQELERAVGLRGRPSELQLTAIAEGRGGEGAESAAEAPSPATEE